MFRNKSKLKWTRPDGAKLLPNVPAGLCSVDFILCVCMCVSRQAGRPGKAITGRNQAAKKTTLFQISFDFYLSLFSHRILEMVCWFLYIMTIDKNVKNNIKGYRNVVTLFPFFFSLLFIFLVPLLSLVLTNSQGNKQRLRWHYAICNIINNKNKRKGKDKRNKFNWIVLNSGFYIFVIELNF